MKEGHITDVWKEEEKVYIQVEFEDHCWDGYAVIKCEVDSSTFDEIRRVVGKEKE